jgi:hypothetical protein
MLTFRNLSFVIFCISFVYAGATTLKAECYAPGLIGYGETEYEALYGCWEDAVASCQSKCTSSCQRAWTSAYECDAYGSGSSWSAAGHCVCAPEG